VHTTLQPESHISHAQKPSLALFSKGKFCNPISSHAATELCNGNSFLVSGAEMSCLPPLLQEKDTELQAVSIPHILFPAPKLPFHFLKKEVKATELKPVQSSHSSITRICHGQFTKRHQKVSVLQSPKKTTLISARALADKSKHYPAQNTCFLITA